MGQWIIKLNLNFVLIQLKNKKKSFEYYYYYFLKELLCSPSVQLIHHK